jgi:hypothetical protein
MKLSASTVRKYPVLTVSIYLLCLNLKGELCCDYYHRQPNWVGIGAKAPSKFINPHVCEICDNQGFLVLVLKLLSLVQVVIYKGLPAADCMDESGTCQKHLLIYVGLSRTKL